MNKIQLKYPEIEIVKNIQERVITSNNSGIEGLVNEVNFKQRYILNP
jgi:hypothetical protein